MNTKKLLAMLTGCVMSVSMLAGMPVSAAEYAQGDVDMDGYITGHDAAMVSRYLNVDSNLFSEEQLALADMNEDGVVDQTDADLIHENQVYYLGNISGEGPKSYNPFPDVNIRITVELQGAFAALLYFAEENIGKTITVTEADPQMLGCRAVVDSLSESDTINQLAYNLIDCDGDNKVTLDDAVVLMRAYLVDVVESTDGEYFVDGRYDITWETIHMLPDFSEDDDPSIGIYY